MVVTVLTLHGWVITHYDLERCVSRVLLFTQFRPNDTISLWKQQRTQDYTSQWASFAFPKVEKEENLLFNC